MSDEVKKDFNANMAREAEFDRIKAENSETRALIDRERLKSQLERIEQAKKDEQLVKNANIGALTPEDIEQIRRDNAEYMAAAKNSMMFINKEFKGVVSYFRKNIILIGAMTGHGKSTTVANIAYSTIRQINPLTGKNRRVLIISNEEKREDVYNRITCLQKGWHYVNHDQFTEEQLKTFDRHIVGFAGAGIVTVIDQNYGGGNGMTTTPEGFQTIFDKLLQEENKYDAIIIDYYQNITHSKNDPSMSVNEAQAKFANILDTFKNLYPAPVVLLAQLAPGEEDAPFTVRLKGRKLIADVATVILEMEADREHLKTNWHLHKGRFTSKLGQTFETGYDNGLFVEYTDAFKLKVLEIIKKRESDRQNKAIGIQSS